MPFFRTQLTMDLLLEGSHAAATGSWAEVVEGMRGRNPPMELRDSVKDDKMHSVLAFFGGAGHSTGQHLDKTRGPNAAFPINPEDWQKDPDTGDLPVLSLWLFSPPTAASIEAMDDFFRKPDNEDLLEACPYGLSMPPDAVARGEAVNGPMTADQMRRIAADPALKALGVRIVEQRSLDEVTVPPGWIHAVVNLRPCIKFAFNIVREADLIKCAVVQHLIGSGVFGQVCACMYVCMYACMHAWSLEKVTRHDPHPRSACCSS